MVDQAAYASGVSKALPAAGACERLALFSE